MLEVEQWHFRRRLTDGSYDRGVAAYGDYWTDISDGWMVWDDVLACLSKMKITELSGGSGYDNGITDRYSGDGLSGQIGLYRDGTEPGDEMPVAFLMYDTDAGDEQAGPPEAIHALYPPRIISSQSSSIAYYIHPNAASVVSSIELYFIPTAPAGGAFNSFGTGLSYADTLNYVASLSPGSGGLMPSALLLQVASGSAFGTIDTPAQGFEADTSTGTCWYGIVIWDFTNSN
ncbi:MAG: hypothetical protein JW713_05755 [Pontiellaceae bacterium]|nr:hypothetical protein [Pontiellaceae bacterium]